MWFFSLQHVKFPIWQWVTKHLEMKSRSLSLWSTQLAERVMCLTILKELISDLTATQFFSTLSKPMLHCTPHIRQELAGPQILLLMYHLQDRRCRDDWDLLAGENLPLANDKTWKGSDMLLWLQSPRYSGKNALKLLHSPTVQKSLKTKQEFSHIHKQWT